MRPHGSGEGLEPGRESALERTTDVRRSAETAEDMIGMGYFPDEVFLARHVSDTPPAPLTPRRNQR
jgi:hypothetical protein